MKLIRSDFQCEMNYLCEGKNAISFLSFDFKDKLKTEILTEMQYNNIRMENNQLSVDIDNNLHKSRPIKTMACIVHEIIK